MKKIKFTVQKQQKMNKILCDIFNIEHTKFITSDCYIETISSNIAPQLFGENNGMFNKSHTNTAKKKVSDANKGKIVVKDTDGNYHSVTKDDPKYISKEYIPNATGKIAVKDKDGNKFLIENNDPRYLSGELVGVVKGKTWKQKDTTNHGNKGTILAKNRDGHKIRLLKNDPRYLSGEYIHFRSKFF